jgi:membrane-associated protease RseP (regulator of RpoE activity)
MRLGRLWRICEDAGKWRGIACVLLCSNAADAAGAARGAPFGSPVAFTAYLRQDRRAIELLRDGTAPEVMAHYDSWVADRRGMLGVAGFDSPAEEEAERNRLALPASGALVKSPVSDGAAERAGLRPREIIVAVADREVHSFADIQEALSGLQAGQTVAIRVVRDGEEQTLSGVLRSPSGWD